MKKLLIVIALLVLAGIGAAGYYRYFGQTAPPEVTTVPLSRGDIVASVGATGAIEAVTTVQVGSQVSGTIQQLYADFNSVVRKGQVIARLDPSLLQTQIEQARANLARSEADVERLRVSLDDARSKLKRNEELAARNLVARQDLESTQIAVRLAEAQLRSSLAAVTQARASLTQNEVNLRHTVIEAPIDGIVVSRNVDVGQTVAASFNAPVLFVIAADLTKMRVNANIDEADVGRIRPGQPVRFRVDAFPNEDFVGRVAQVRLQPQVVQNVVTYATVIEVPNPELKLKPGMTATVTIEIARRASALRIPNAALRFRPSTEIFAALGQPVPEDFQRGFGPGRGGPGGGQPGGGGSPGAAGGAASGSTGAAAPAASGGVPAPGAAPAGAGRSSDGDAPTAAPPTRATAQAGSAAPSPGGGAGMGDVDPAERRRRFMERLASMSPEEREQALQRMRDRGIDTSAFTGGAPGAAPASRAAAAGTPAQAAQDQPRPRRQPAAPAQGADTPAWQQAQTIDALFPPLAETVTPGRAWLYVGGQLKMVRLRLGVSDGTYTEVLTEELQPGQEVVTSVALPNATATRATGGQSPLMGPQRPTGPPGMRNTTPSR
jgi:HlyD family secretion protein